MHLLHTNKFANSGFTFFSKFKVPRVSMVVFWVINLGEGLSWPLVFSCNESNLLNPGLFIYALACQLAQPYPNGI